MNLSSHMKQYLVKFAGRLLVFLLLLLLYAFRREEITRFMEARSFMEIRDNAVLIPLLLLWVLFLWTMAVHLFPGILPERFHTCALLKSVPENAALDPAFLKEQLPPILIGQNRGARYVMLAWLVLNGPVYLLYRNGVIGGAELLLVTVFYYVCDYICILIWCPFQTFLMKCKCCVNCRIFDWGHIMMFTPMGFAEGIFPRVLFLVSAAVFIRWEICFAKYPAQFNERSNMRLRCVNCRDRICSVKKAVKKMI